MRKLLPLLAGALLLTACTAPTEVKTLNGYMSIDSPMDGSCIYMCDAPLSIGTDCVKCYPPKGCAFIYEEQCIRVTGTVSDGSTLIDCTYEVVAPTAAIQAYNEDVSSGVFATLDDWLGSIRQYIAEPSTAEEVSSAHYEVLLMDTNVPYDVKSKLIQYTQEYNEWLSNGKPEDNTLDATYAEIQEVVSDWFESLRVQEDS